MPSPIPVISNIPGLQQWRTALTQIKQRPATPKVPWNFQVSSKQGGNFLSWQAVDGADGYIVDISTNGDFSSGVQGKKLPGNQNTSYFDSVPTSGGTAPAIRYYRVRATTGNDFQAQSVEGPTTGVLSSSAIAPNDTVTASTTTSDTVTNDNTQSKAGRRYYFDFT